MRDASSIKYTTARLLMTADNDGIVERKGGVSMANYEDVDELEIGSPSAVPPLKYRHGYRRFIGIMAMLVTVLSLTFLTQEDDDVALDDVEWKQSSKLGEGDCSLYCPALRKELQKRYKGDVLNTTFLLQTVKKEQSKLNNMLKRDYGEEAFQSMWVDTTSGNVLGYQACNSANEQSNVSYIKFRRKLQMKILEVQMGVIDRSTGRCDCQGRKTYNNRKPNFPDDTRFVWATGGHSAAAGHGNLYNESYTAFMVRGVKNVFESIGIDFVGRNYGMGGMDSGPQLALWYVLLNAIARSQIVLHSYSLLAYMHIVKKLCMEQMRMSSHGILQSSMEMPTGRLSCMQTAREFM